MMIKLLNRRGGIRGVQSKLNYRVCVRPSLFHTTRTQSESNQQHPSGKGEGHPNHPSQSKDTDFGSLLDKIKQVFPTSDEEPNKEKKSNSNSDTNYTDILNGFLKQSAKPMSSQLDQWWGSMTSTLPDSKGLIGSVMNQFLGSSLGSLLDKSDIESVIKKSQDPNVHPEIKKDATVRLSEELSEEEKLFLSKRKETIRKSFAKFIGVDEKEVDPRDIPTIAIGGSGGGYRAMISFLGGMMAAKKIGLWDCVSYVAGVSGSCWAINGYYTMGGGDFDKLYRHLRSRVSIAPTHLSSFLNIVDDPDLSESLISGLVRKYHGNTAMSMADIFGTLLAARLSISDHKPDNQLDHHFKLSNQAHLLQDGTHPLPIYTAIHRPSDNLSHDKDKDELQPFRWFEFTPYEMGSVEMGAWIPTWSLGRQFDHGNSISRDREMESNFLMGIFGSAFCATIAHIADELTPSLPGPIAGWYSQLADEYYHNMLTIHPIPPSEINNPFYNLKRSDRSRDPTKLSQVNDKPHLTLMDAGMDNNLPLYPLLHPHRDVDVILVLDASDDVESTPWFPRTDSYAQSLGQTRWPTGLNPWHADREKPFNQVHLAPTETKSSSSSPSSPIDVLYFPLQAHPEIPLDPAADPVCSTYNFAYQDQPYDHLVKLSHTNVIQQLDTIRDVIKKAWVAKRDTRLA